MSVSSRIRGRLIGGCVAAGAVCALVFAPAAGAFTVGNTYLALGDSLAYGYHQAQFLSELPNVNPATFDQGYVDDFGDLVHLINPHVQTINDGCPGETTDTFINGSGTAGFCAGGAHGTPFPYSFLHHPYAASSQLADALGILAANPHVSPITLDIGANDVLQFLESSCGFPATDTCTPAQVAGEYGHVATNLAIILTALHAAAPHAEIVVLGLYNPFPTVLPAPGGDAATAELNSALAAVTKSIPGASFADPEPAFNPAGTAGKPESGDIPTICALTGMCPGGTYNPASPSADIHPTTLGYAVLGGFVAADFLTH
jgi:lysophospholipase L1-like esterase